MSSSSSSSWSSSPSSTPVITVTVRTTTGTVLEVPVSPNDSIPELKARLATTFNVFSDQQRLVFAGKELVAGKLGDYGVCQGSTITLAPAMHSGPLYAAKRTSLFGKHDLSAILRTLNEDQIAFLLNQKKPVTVTTKIGDQLVVFTLMPAEGEVEEELVEAGAAMVAEQAATAFASPPAKAPVRRASQSTLVTSHPAPATTTTSTTTTTTTATTSSTSGSSPEGQQHVRHPLHHAQHQQFQEFQQLQQLEQEETERRERRKHRSHHHHRHHHHHHHEHLDTPEKIREHKRRKEAQREQRKKNEVLKSKVALLLQQMREKRTGDAAPFVPAADTR